MQDNPRTDAPGGAPASESVEHRVQRWVMLELVTVPPPEGDRVAVLASGLRERVSDVEAAVDALVSVGLAVRDGDVVRPTPAALHFEALFPVRT